MMPDNSEALPQGHIGSIELIAILVTMATGKIHLIYAERILRAGATAAWAIPILAGLFSIVWLLSLMNLLERYPGKSLIEITRQLAGTPVAWAFGLALFSYLQVGVSLTLEEIATVLAVGILPLSPVRYLALIFIVSAMVLAMFGLESIGRLSVFIIIVTIVSIVVLALVSVPMWNLHYMFPLQGTGIGKVLFAGLVRQAMYAEFIVVGLLAPYIRFRPGKASRMRRSLVRALVITLFMFTTVVYGIQMILPYPVALNQAAPLLRAARELYLSRFFQRFDMLFVLVWIVAAVMYLALGLYFSGLSLTSTFPILPLRPAIVACALLAGAFAWYVYDYSLAVFLDFDLLRPASTAFVYVWIFLLLALSALRGKPKRTGGRTSG